jgi:hypothetical protein
MSQKGVADKIKAVHFDSGATDEFWHKVMTPAHFDVCESLFKAVDGDQSCWHTATYSVFWSDHITVRRRMGCSPYFAVTGTHPLLPLDISETTYLLLPPPSSSPTVQSRYRNAGSSYHSSILACMKHSCVQHFQDLRL